MKRLLSISLLTLAAVMTMAMMVIPHHHHGDRICMATVHCAAVAGTHTDTEHHHDSDNKHDHHGANEPCPVTTDVVTAVTGENHLKCKAQHVHANHCCGHLGELPLLILAELLLPSSDEGSISEEYGEFVISYRSLDAALPMGLRAPPAV